MLPNSCRVRSLGHAGVLPRPRRKRIVESPPPLHMVATAHHILTHYLSHARPPDSAFPALVGGGALLGSAVSASRRAAAPKDAPMCEDVPGHDLDKGVRRKQRYGRPRRRVWHLDGVLPRPGLLPGNCFHVWSKSSMCGGGGSVMAGPHDATTMAHVVSKARCPPCDNLPINQHVHG